MLFGKLIHKISSVQSAGLKQNVFTFNAGAMYRIAVRNSTEEDKLQDMLALLMDGLEGDVSILLLNSYRARVVATTNPKPDVASFLEKEIMEAVLSGIPLDKCMISKRYGILATRIFSLCYQKELVGCLVMENKKWEFAVSRSDMEESMKALATVVYMMSLKERMENQIFKDSLTGLFTRDSLLSDMDVIYSKNSSINLEGYFMSLVHIKNMECLNETLGVEKTDSLLVDFATYLVKMNGGYTYRIGGRKFVLILRGDEIQAHSFLMDLYDELEERNPQISFSVVGTPFLEDAHTTLFTCEHHIKETKPGSVTMLSEKQVSYHLEQGIDKEVIFIEQMESDASHMDEPIGMQADGKCCYEDLDKNVEVISSVKPIDDPFFRGLKLKNIKKG